VRAAPLSGNQQESPAVGYGDLGEQNLGGSMTGINASIAMRPNPTPRTRSPHSSAVLDLNRDPAAGPAALTVVRPPSVLSSSSRATVSSVNGAPGLHGSRLHVPARGSLV